MNSILNLQGKKGIIFGIANDKSIAWASKQSSEIPNIRHLKKKILFYEKKFSDSEVPRPKYWRGILIQPQNFEFWTQGQYRIHEREFYYKKSGEWFSKKLSP